MTRSSRWIGCLALAAIASAPATAQLFEYSSPGAGGVEPAAAREALAAAVDEARWRLGPLRLDPTFGLDEVAWVEPSDGDGDLTATFRAGLRGYVPVGSRTVVAVHALPSYVWWQDRSDASRVAGEYGAGLFLHANRLGIEVRASSDDLTTRLSSESEDRAELREDRIEARLEVPVWRSIGLFGRVGRIEAENAERSVIFDRLLARLDRRDEWTEGGLSFRLGRWTTFGAGVGRSESTFDEAAADRSNDGDYAVYELRVERPKLGVQASVRRVELDGAPGSEFGSLRDTIGSIQLRFRPRPKVEWAIYGSRSLQFTVLAEEAFLVEERIGARVGLEFHERLGLTLFAEDGELRFGEEERPEELTSVAASLRVGVRKALFLEVGVRRSERGAGDAAREDTELLGSLAWRPRRGAWF